MAKVMLIVILTLVTSFTTAAKLQPMPSTEFPGYLIGRDTGWVPGVTGIDLAYHPIVAPRIPPCIESGIMPAISSIWRVKSTRKIVIGGLRPCPPGIPE